MKQVMDLASSIETVAVYRGSRGKDIQHYQHEEQIISKLKFLVNHFQIEIHKENVEDAYTSMCLHLLKNNSVSKNCKNFRLWEACYVANKLRTYELESVDPEQIKGILIFLMEELVYVKNKPVHDPDFALCLYLLETVANAKSFNVCLQLEDPVEILCYLFDLMFLIINEQNSAIVQPSILDVLGGLLFECGMVPIPSEILRIILKNIIEPEKLSNQNTYNLAKELIIRCLIILKPSLHNFLNTVMVRQEDDSDLEYEIRCREVDCVREELNDIFTSATIVSDISDVIQEEYCLQTCQQTEEMDETRMPRDVDQKCDTNVTAEDVKKEKEEHCAQITRTREESYNILTERNRMYNVSLKFKTHSIPATFFSVAGRPDNVENLVNDDTVITIQKKYCLNQATAAVAKMLEVSLDYEVFVCAPLVQGTSMIAAEHLFSHLVTYLEKKEAAAIVHLRKDMIPDPRVLSVLCAFPPCSFSSELIRKFCPNLKNSSDYWRGLKQYLVVVATTYQIFEPMVCSS